MSGTPYADVGFCLECATQHARDTEHHLEDAVKFSKGDPKRATFQELLDSQRIIRKGVDKLRMQQIQETGEETCIACQLPIEKDNPDLYSLQENDKKQVYLKLLRYVEEGDAILTAGEIHEAIPTIHNFYPQKYYTSIKHLGFGFFEGETEQGKFSFDAGGAMHRNGRISWTLLRAKENVLKDLGYDSEKVKNALKELIGKGHNPGSEIPEYCEFTHEEVKPKEYFDKASFRTLCPESPTRLCKDLPPELACATRIIIGCEQGQFLEGKCQVGTETHTIYHGMPKPSLSLSNSSMVNPEYEQISPELERIRQLHIQAIPDDPGRSIDFRTGQQLERFWLPEPLKQELIAESKRPEGKKTGIAAIKYFNPGGAGTWWISEYDPESDAFFGIAKILEVEYGHISRKELRETRVPPFGVWIERDYYWTPKPLEEIMREEKRFR